jgi:hypothetical protein
MVEALRRDAGVDELVLRRHLTAVGIDEEHAHGSRG